jgi:hypothetical protein
MKQAPIIIFGLLLLGLLLWTVPIAHSQEHKKSEEVISEEASGGSSFESYVESVEEAKKKKARAFKGFGAYKGRVKKMCKLIGEDGHSEWFAVTSKRYANSMKDCAPCRSMYAMLAGSCLAGKTKLVIKKTPLPKVEKADANKEIPTSVPTKSEVKLKQPAWDPSTELLDIVSRVFSEMSDDKEVAEENFRAVKHLTDQMLMDKTLSNARASYFKTLSRFMLTPFEIRGIGKNKNEEDSYSSSEQAPKVSIDTLF